MVIENHFCERNVQEILDVTVVQADNSTFRRESEVTVEHFMEICLGGQPVLKLVCTPENLAELAVGRLVSDGYIAGEQDIESIFADESGQHVKVDLTNKMLPEAFLKAEPSFCTTNRQVYDLKNETMAVLPKAYYSAEWIFELAKEFAKGSRIHKRTKGAHSCLLMYNGKIVYGAEDIGRHNALDKAVGYAVMNGFDRENCIVFTSGRVPVDMAQKVIRARIPIIVSKAVPTYAAVRLAKEYNLTLICKAWQDSYEVFHDAAE